MQKVGVLPVSLSAFKAYRILPHMLLGGPERELPSIKLEGYGFTGIGMRKCARGVYKWPDWDPLVGL